MCLLMSDSKSGHLTFQRCLNVSAPTDQDQDLTPFIGTGTTDYPGYLSIQPGIFSPITHRTVRQCIHSWYSQPWTSDSGSVESRKSMIIVARSHSPVVNCSRSCSEHHC